MELAEKTENEALELVSATKCFDGQLQTYTHYSESCNCNMQFSIYLPPQAEKTKVPVLYWLSGLTCTDENFMQKAGAQQYAAKHGIAIVCPDTSPRGDDVPDEKEAWDFGKGAGFYVNATAQPWSKHYHMYDYVTKELPQIVEANFSVSDKKSIFGHSMGGHGALIAVLKNPNVYKSVSAFAPICAPSQCPWGEKALGNYLGQDKAKWAEYDTNELVKSAEEKLPILIDQGDKDQFLNEQLKPEILEKTCKELGYPLTINMRKGYDHSYFFISSFVEGHLAHHAKYLVG